MDNLAAAREVTALAPAGWSVGAIQFLGNGAMASVSGPQPEDGQLVHHRGSPAQLVKIMRRYFEMRTGKR